MSTIIIGFKLGLGFCLALAVIWLIGATILSISKWWDFRPIRKSLKQGLKERKNEPCQ